MSKKRGLGKGLAELIPTAGPPQPGETIAEIAVEIVDPNPYQPRTEFNEEELAELAASIKAQGLLQPITVRPTADGRYQLVAGERRLRAVRNLGRTVINAIVRKVTDKQLLELSLVENLLRSDLNDIEVAQALQKLQNTYGYTTTQLAEITGKSRPAVSNTLRLLELPEEVQGLIREKRLTAGHGRAILSFPAEQRVPTARKCVEAGMSVREMERQAVEATHRTPVKRPRRKVGAVPSAPSALKSAEQRLVEHLGTKVRISEQRGHGTINITYHGAEDLDRLLSMLMKDSSPI